jgi:hypothetical protein
MYSNAGIVGADTRMPDGSVRHRRPMFDITVSAEKQSPFSRAAQNELIKELYGMGLFAPENSQAALVCIDGLEFEGKEKIRQQIEQNSIFLQQMNAAMGMIQNLSMMDPRIAQMAMQQGLLDPEMAAQMQQAQMQGPAQEGTAEERAARAATGGDNSQAAKARAKAANLTIPN